MKTARFHISNLGMFVDGLSPDTEGYVTYHDSKRYRNARMMDLRKWTESRNVAIRNAAWAEINERKLNVWRSLNDNVSVNSR